MPNSHDYRDLEQRAGKGFRIFVLPCSKIAGHADAHLIVCHEGSERWVDTIIERKQLEGDHEQFYQRYVMPAVAYIQSRISKQALKT